MCFEISIAYVYIYLETTYYVEVYEKTWHLYTPMQSIVCNFLYILIPFYF